eukprot:gene17013-biopygen4833
MDREHYAAIIFIIDTDSGEHGEHTDNGEDTDSGDSLPLCSFSDAKESLEKSDLIVLPTSRCTALIKTWRRDARWQR